MKVRNPLPSPHPWDCRLASEPIWACLLSLSMLGNWTEELSCSLKGPDWKGHTRSLLHSSGTLTKPVFREREMNKVATERNGYGQHLASRDGKLWVWLSTTGPFPMDVQCAFCPRGPPVTLQHLLHFVWTEFCSYNQPTHQIWQSLGIFIHCNIYISILLIAQ